MRINENWSIDSDLYNWTLTHTQHKEREEKGELIQYVTEDKTYHATLKQAFKYLVSQDPKSAKTLEELDTKLDALHKLIEENIK